MKGWGINNRTLYRRAMSIQHRMDRIAKTEKPKTEKVLHARFGERDFRGDLVMAVQNLSKSFGDRVLFSDVELTVGGDERIALLGDNGTGKSTFLKILLGEETPSGGKIKFGPSVKMGYLPQILHFDHPERTLLDTMLYETKCTVQSARDRLGSFLFQGEDAFKVVGTLSGGEQMRLKLCMLMEQKINLLILDEPTNHLDIPSREWMEAAMEHCCLSPMTDILSTTLPPVSGSWTSNRFKIIRLAIRNTAPSKSGRLSRNRPLCRPSQRPKRKSPGTPAIWKNRLQSWSGKSKSRSSWWRPMNRRLRRQLRITRN